MKLEKEIYDEIYSLNAVENGLGDTDLESFHDEVLSAGSSQALRRVIKTFHSNAFDMLMAKISNGEYDQAARFQAQVEVLTRLYRYITEERPPETLSGPIVEF